MDKGLVGTLLRYRYEVRYEQEYFDEIQDVKVTKDMLDLGADRNLARASAIGDRSLRRWPCWLHKPIP